MNATDLAISTNLFARNTLDFALASLGRAGFDRLELWGHVAQFHPGYLDERQARQIGERVRDAGFDIVSFFPEGGAYPLNPASTDEALRRDTVGYYRHAIDLGRAMGVRRMTFHPGHGLRDRPPEEAVSAAARTWRALGLYAIDSGIEVSLCHCTAVGLGSIDQLGALVEATGVAIGVALDVSLAAQAPDAMQKCLAQGGPINAVRLSDGPGEHLAFGDGHLPLRAICGNIIDSGYWERTIITLDNRRYVLDPDRAVRQTAAWTGAP